MTLFKRILVEKRSLVLPLALVIVVNIGVYGLVVRPLEVKSAGAADRAETATAALKAADDNYAAARVLVEGKMRADQELSTFYGKVVPADLSSARRMTYATLPALARKANVKYEQRTFDVEPIDKNARLGHLRIRMVLEGTYESVRRFIYELESAPQFVIIDNMTLAQNDPTKPLTLALELSAYYRLGLNGS